MSDSENAGFAKFVPGFDFLQNLTKGTAEVVPQMPNLANWIAPTLNVEELDKRIAELKAVHFWLDQNSKALGATVQALEVQKMTLATLKGMNFNIGDLANAFKLKAATGRTVADAAETAEAAKKVSDAAKPAAAGLVDPLQLWQSLTQQFQTIAAGAMKEASKATAVNTGKNLAKSVLKQTASGVPAKKATAKRAAVKKTAPKVAARATSRPR